MYPTIQSVVNVGDHKQLAPTVMTRGREHLNPYAEQIYLAQFGRYAALGFPMVKLGSQLRATEGLMWFSNERCYFGELVDGEGTALDHPSRQLSRRIRRFHQKAFNHESHWLFLNVKNSVNGYEGKSSNNRDFALVTLNYIRRLYQYFTDMDEMRPSQICIITPYNAKIKLYTMMIRELSQLPQWEPLSLEKIHISSIDGVQGQEYDLVIGDLVKAGAEGDVGFVRELTRLNVLNSRMKKVSSILKCLPPWRSKLIIVKAMLIVADSDLLSKKKKEKQKMYENLQALFDGARQRAMVSINPATNTMKELREARFPRRKMTPGAAVSSTSAIHLSAVDINITSRLAKP